MVRYLSFNEVIGIDLDRVAAADTASALRFDDLIAALCEAETAWAESRWNTLRQLAQSIALSAGEMGMETVASVADQVAALTLTKDGAGLAASVARLVRVGEASLAAVWDMQDMRGRPGP